jgi:hypothetical protein
MFASVVRWLVTDQGWMDEENSYADFVGERTDRWPSSFVIKWNHDYNEIAFHEYDQACT